MAEQDLATRRLISYLRAEAWQYGLGVAALLLTNLCTAGIPYLTKLIFDALEGGGADAVRRVGVLVGGIVALATAMAVFRVGSRVFIFNGGRRVEYALRNDVYRHMQTLSPAFFGRLAVGDLVSRTTNDITAMRLLGGPGVLNIANTAPEVVEPEVDDEPAELRGGITFDGLTFRYPGTETDVLRDVALHIEPGEQVLIVGPSGAGKSTLVSLLPHLSALPEGVLRLDGRDVHRWSLRTLRRRIAFVPQESFLFSMTVAENIGFGLDEPLRRAIEEAADMAALTGDIARFPRGFETLVGERGVTLSGGQRQRMTIARAAALEPSIWVFDDCLSSVDAGTEQAIIRNLRAMTSQATALFVTHRLLGFEGVDKVVVLEGGRVTEVGSHRELLEHGGWYARLYRRQKLDQELGAPMEASA